MCNMEISSQNGLFFWSTTVNMNDEESGQKKKFNVIIVRHACYFRAEDGLRAFVYGCANSAISRIKSSCSILIPAHTQTQREREKKITIICGMNDV